MPYATYASFFGIGLLASPHFTQLCAHKSRYFSSSAEPIALAALMHISLGSGQPSSLHKFEMYLQTSCTSLGSNTALLVRTNRQSSLAITQVLTYLIRSRTSLRKFFRLISNCSFVSYWHYKQQITENN